MRNYEWGLIALVILSLAVAGAAVLKVDQLSAQPMGTTHFSNLETEDLAVTDDLTVTGDATVGGTFEATGATTLTGAVGLSAGLTVATIGNFTAATAISCTNGGYITATGTYQPLTSAGNVGLSSVAIGTAGDLLVLINSANTTITISDTSTTMLTGDIALGQYDSLTLWCDGTNWLQISTANN